MELMYRIIICLHYPLCVHKTYWTDKVHGDCVYIKKNNNYTVLHFLSSLLVVFKMR